MAKGFFFIIQIKGTFIKRQSFWQQAFHIFQGQKQVKCLLKYLDFNKMSGEKARLEQHKDAAYCFEQILEATPYKTAAVWPLPSYLINHPSKMKKAC